MLIIILLTQFKFKFPILKNNIDFILFHIYIIRKRENKKKKPNLFLIYHFCCCVVIVDQINNKKVMICLCY